MFCLMQVQNWSFGQISTGVQQFQRESSTVAKTNIGRIKDHGLNHVGKRDAPARPPWWANRRRRQAESRVRKTSPGSAAPASSCCAMSAWKWELSKILGLEIMGTSIVTSASNNCALHWSITVPTHELSIYIIKDDTDSPHHARCSQLLPISDTLHVNVYVEKYMIANYKYTI